MNPELSQSPPSGSLSSYEVLLVRPTAFRIDYKINPYMKGRSDHRIALQQWKTLVKTMREHATVSTVDFAHYPPTGSVAVEDLPDAVFVSNQAVPVRGENKFILAEMKHDERAGEVAYFEKWATEHGYETERLPGQCNFEGNGEAKWHPGKDILWTGHGRRTELGAINEVDRLIDSRVIPLELVSDQFYHLDVCFTPLDRETVLITEPAFTTDSLETIHTEFDTVLHVPPEDYDTMGGNTGRIGPDVFGIDAQNTATMKLLHHHGYKVIPVATSEFLKAGGSVDCLFLRLP